MKKKLKVGKRKKISINKITAFFKNEDNKKIFGGILVLFSISIFIAFSSYFFEGASDYDKINNQSWFEIILNKNIQINNMLGKLGAILAYQFVHVWFGITAFLIPFFSLICGIRILNVKWLSIRKLLFNILLLLILIPVTLYHLTGISLISGGIGVFTSQFLIDLIGKIGTTLLISTIIILYIIINFKLSLKKLYSKIKETFVNNKIDNVKEKNEESLSKNIESNSVESGVELKKGKEEEEEVVVVKDSSSETDNEDINIEIKKGSREEKLSEEEIEKKLKELGDYDPTKELSTYQMPKIDILKDYGEGEIKIDNDELENNKNLIVDTLANYKIGITSVTATVGPTITLYEIVPEAGVRISKIKNLEDDIALSLAAEGIRIIAPIPGKGTIGIEVPNKSKNIVSMLDVISSERFQNSDMALPIAFGKTISNETLVVDLAKMPHLLMAGATGQGKSVGLNAILVSLLYKKHPSQIKFVLIDPKKVELTLFNKIERHYLAKLPDAEDAIITDTKKVVNTINSLCIEMDQRYDLCKIANCRNVIEYNKKFISRRLNPNKGHKYLPYIVVVIDEFADLIMTAGKEIETPIARLAQLARAVGIHLIVATQRPSVNVITGLIKANFPARVAFRVTSKIDSRTILDTGGADQLIGMGDMLISNGSELVRLQCAFVDTPEVEAICEYIGSQRAYPDAHILPEFIGDADAVGGKGDLSDKDALFEDAARLVVQHQSGSTSLIQRRLKLGYNRAGRIIDQLEAAGVVGPFEGSKARQVLIRDENALIELLNNLNNE